MSRIFAVALLVVTSWTFGVVSLAVAPPAAPAPALSPQEKQPEAQRATGYVRPTPEQERKYKAISRARHGSRITRAAKNLALPAKFDVRDRVKIDMGDQANCGSCYLYSTVWDTFTGAGIWAGQFKDGSTFRLSVQYGMDRPRSFGGCNGGWGVEVADWTVKNGWVAEYYVDQSGVKHTDYPPYEARVGNDRTPPGAKRFCVGWTWGYVNADRDPSIEEIKAAMFLHGMLNVAIDAGGQFGSGKGTITQLGTQINHEISCVAYDDDAANPDGTKGAVLLRNQWSSQWGTNGYRWCTYKAAARIVDWFYVSAGDPVPPPPPPPPPGTIPVVTGGTAVAQVNKPFAYQIIATASPTSYTTIGLPAGLTCDEATGKVTGTPTAEGSFAVLLTAGNAAGVGAARLTLVVGTTPPPPPPPPGPNHATSVVITFSDGTTQTMLGKEAVVELMQRAWTVPTVPQAPPADPRWESLEKRLDEQQRSIEALLRNNEALNKLLTLPKEKK